MESRVYLSRCNALWILLGRHSCVVMSSVRMSAQSPPTVAARPFGHSDLL